MKVLLVNGSPNEHGCTYTALSEVADTLHKHGIETELVYLSKKPVAGGGVGCESQLVHFIPNQTISRPRTTVGTM